MNEMQAIGARIRALREEHGVSAEDMADELEVSLATYSGWEETGEDVPISAIYHIAREFDVEFAEILTGTSEKLTTYQVVRSGEGKEVDRYPGYYYEDLAWRFSNKIMQPLLVVVEPGAEPAALVSHDGQEFNLVIEGTVIVNWGDKEFALNEGDCIYFNPSVPHGQRCGSDVPARFVTFIAE